MAYFMSEHFARKLADLDEAVAAISDPDSRQSFAYDRDYLVLCATKGKLGKHRALDVMQTKLAQIAREHPNAQL